MVLNTEVKFFESSQSTRDLSGTAGTLIPILNDCLVDGFGEVTLQSLSVTDNVATATHATAHGFVEKAGVGPVIRIAGATPTTLNGDWRVDVTSTTQFTFVTSGIDNVSATGTITAKYAPLGWSKPYSSTNKATYARTNPKATSSVIQVDDSTTTYATIKVYESQSQAEFDAGSGTNLWPSGSRYAVKSATSNSTERAWAIIGDSQLFYLLVYSNTDYEDSLVFGDIIPTFSGDAYCCWLCCSDQTSYNDSNLFYVDGTANGSDMPRTYTGLGGSIAVGRYSTRLTNTYLGNGVITYPNPANNSVFLFPVNLVHTNILRGRVPGLWNPAHTITYYSSMPTSLSNIPELTGRTLIKTIISYSATSMAYFDITGPWR